MTQEVSVNSQEEDAKKLVLASYFKWFLGSFFLICVAVFCALLANHYYPFSPISKNILQLFSILLTGSVLGKRGYDIQTWGGESSAEKLNDKIFLILSSIGFFLATFSYYLR